MFRQQALAERWRTSDLAAVVSSGRLRRPERGPAGVGVWRVADVRTGWGPLFRGQAGFVVWSHQAWFRWVAEAEAEDAPAWAADWLDWVSDRYGYAAEGGGG